MKKNLFDDDQLNVLLFDSLLPSYSEDELEGLKDHSFSSLHETKMEGLFSSLKHEEMQQHALPLIGLLKNALAAMLFFVLLSFPSLSSLAHEATNIHVESFPGQNSVELRFFIQGEALPPPILKVHSLPDGCRLNKEEISPHSHMRDYVHPMGYILQIEKMQPPTEGLLIKGDMVWDKKEGKHYYIYQKQGRLRTVYLFKNNWLYRVTTSKSLLFSQEILENVD